MENVTENSKKADAAEANFLCGYNCAQSLVLAFAQELGLSREAAAALSSGFGGGMGRMRETCGAVTGMFLVAGSCRGYSQPEDVPGKQKTYEMIQELARQFQEKTGSLLCRVLLGEEGTDQSPVPSPRTTAYYETRPCPGLLRTAAAILEDYLEKHP